MSEAKTNTSKQIHLIRLNYRSGNSFEVWCEDFSIKHNNGKLTSVTYTSSSEGPRALLLGIQDIESILQIDSKEVENVVDTPVS